METITTQTRKLPTRRAISGLVVALILIGVGSTMTIAAMSGVQDNLGAMTGSNRIAITSVNAYTDGDRLVISGDVKNLGSQALSSIIVDEISAGSLLITQSPFTEDGIIPDGHGDMDISGVTDTGVATETGTVDYGDAVVAATTTGTVTWAAATAGNADRFYFNDGSTAATGVATVELIGLSVDESNLVGLAAGESNRFRIIVTGISAGGHADVLDILRSVPSGTELYITLFGTDGQSSTASDPRTATVRQR